MNRRKGLCFKVNIEISVLIFCFQLELQPFNKHTSNKIVVVVVVVVVVRYSPVMCNGH